MKKVSGPEVVTTLEASKSPLPAEIQQALGDLVGAARDGLLALSVGLGLGVLHELIPAAGCAHSGTLSLRALEGVRRGDRDGAESMTTRSVHKNGSDLYVELSFALVNDGAGGVLSAVAMARDVMSRYMTRTRRRVGASRSWRSRSRPCPLGIDRSCFGCKLVLED